MIPSERSRKSETTSVVSSVSLIRRIDVGGYTWSIFSRSECGKVHDQLGRRVGQPHHAVAVGEVHGEERAIPHLVEAHRDP